MCGVVGIAGNSDVNLELYDVYNADTEAKILQVW